MGKLRTYLGLERPMWLLAIASGTTLFSGGLVAAFITVLLWRLGASFLNIGYVASLYNVSLALAFFLGGSLSERFGRKRIFIISLLCSLLAILCYGIANLLLSWLIVALGLLFGRLAWGFRMTSSFSVVSSAASEKKRATAFGLVSTLGYVGSILGPIVGGVLASFHGLFVPFLLAILLMAVAIVLILLKLEKGEITSKRAIASLTEVKEAIRIEKSITVLVLLAIIGQFFNEFGNPYYFIFLESELKAPEYIMGITQSMLSIGSVIIAFPGGHFSDVFQKRKPFLVFGSFLATIGVGLTAFAVNSLMVVATYLFFGLSNALFMISLQAYFTDIAGMRKSLVFGVYQAASWFAGIPAPPIAGSIAEVYGLRGPFIVNFIGSLIVSSLLLILFTEKKKSNKWQIHRLH
ncbi:MFS transporter [Candidatus Bathyarchaeota archaeon]|nr:MFS transporter [Candidatus Bathyarchaeota archaeon]